MKQLSIQFLLLSCLVLCLSACGGVKLIDIHKSTATLHLSEEQQEITHPKMALVRDIAEDYDFEKSEFQAAYQRYRSNLRLTRVSRYEGGGPNREIYRERNALRIKTRDFIGQRQEFIKEITALVEEIKANLNPEQLAEFEAEIELPELQLPEILRRRPEDQFFFIPGSRMGMPSDF